MSTNKASFPWLALCVGIVILFLDVITKYLTQSNLSPLIYSYSYPYGGIGIFENLGGIEFSIVHHTNKGAAWGMGAEYQFPLLLLRVVLILGLLIYVIFFNKNPSYRIPLAMITAGALGNVLDFFIYGHVIDMFQFVFWGYHYPVFNVADSAIFLGIAALLMLSFKNK